MSNVFCASFRDYNGWLVRVRVLSNVSLVATALSNARTMGELCIFFNVDRSTFEVNGNVKCWGMATGNQWVTSILGHIMKSVERGRLLYGKVNFPTDIRVLKRMNQEPSQTDIFEFQNFKYSVHV